MDNPRTIALDVEKQAQETLNVCPADAQHPIDASKLWAEMEKIPRRVMPTVLDQLTNDTKNSNDVTKPSFELIKKDNSPTGIKIYGGLLGGCNADRMIQYDFKPWQRPLDH